MNLRRKTPNDSLYLLLDTLCNAFGGIILLAVLVVLLTSKEKSQSPSAGDSQEMLQRRLAIAQTNLQQALQLQATLQSKASDERWKAQVFLLDTRRRLEEEIKSIREMVGRDSKELDAAAGLDPTERMKTLSAQLAAAEAHKNEAQNALAAAQENARRLNTRLVSLEKQASELINDSQRQLRLPKEHETSKRVIYVIARYGRIYTCRNADLSRNESDIDWESTFSNEIARPKQGRGIDPVGNAVGLRSYFKALSENSVYVAFCVFEDSFPAFIRAKQLATENRLAYGWDPFRFSDGPVSFGERGHTPKPQ
jgi:F0F1-type ATP synthase membrane subunit b/b'